MNKLPKEFKEKWLAALRSGEYKQGKTELYNKETDSFCCIGVAGLINGLSLDEMKGKSNPVCDPEYTMACLLPVSAVGQMTDMDILIRMNDGSCNAEQKSFPEIADWIEANL